MKPNSFMFCLTLLLLSFQLVPGHKWYTPGLSFVSSPVQCLYQWSGWRDQVHCHQIQGQHQAGWVLNCWRLERLYRGIWRGWDQWQEVQQGQVLGSAVESKQPHEELQAGDRVVGKLPGSKGPRCAGQHLVQDEQALPRWPRKPMGPWPVKARVSPAGPGQWLSIPLYSAVMKPHLKSCIQFLTPHSEKTSRYWSMSRQRQYSW